jgi:hypothetical protein
MIFRWRNARIKNFIHLDDGLGFKDTKEEARQAAMMVKEDLERLGLVTSKEKCMWEPVQQFVWCGFLWDLKEFRVEVTEEKKDRIKSMAKEFLGKLVVTGSSFYWVGNFMCTYDREILTVLHKVLCGLVPGIGGHV